MNILYKNNYTYINIIESHNGEHMYDHGQFYSQWFHQVQRLVECVKYHMYLIVDSDGLRVGRIIKVIKNHAFWHSDQT